MKDLEVARIRAYAATPQNMPAVRYSGKDEPITFNLEIVRLTLSNGEEGVASYASGWSGAEGGYVVDDIREIAAQVLGKSVADREALTESLLADAGDGPWEAISLLDCAMWDAWARSENQQLWQLLGGNGEYRERVEAYASTAAYLTVEEYLDDVRRFAALGYRGIKFHMNTDLDFDIEMVKAVATTFADSGIRFMIDAEQCYTFDEAVKIGRVLDRLPFDWMEAPLPDIDIAAYIELNRAVEIDVIADGNEQFGLQYWADGLKRKAWSRLRCDVTNAGGVSTVLRAIELAESAGVPVELQSYGFQPAQHANLHLMLARKNCTWFEHPAPSGPYDYATGNPLALDEQGCVRAAGGPGLGLEVDWDRIEADAFTSFDSD